MTRRTLNGLQQLGRIVGAQTAVELADGRGQPFKTLTTAVGLLVCDRV